MRPRNRRAFRRVGAVVLASTVLMGLTPVPTPEPGSPAFFVSVTGDDQAAGSLESPFATIGRAQTAMRSGKARVAYVLGGTYALTDPIRLDAAHSGMSFIAYPGQTTVLDGAASGLATLMQVSHASNITLSGFSFTNASSGGAALSLVGSTAIQVVGNNFTGNGTAILLTGSSGNTVSGNRINRSAQSAVEAKDGSHGNTFDSNVITDTGAVASQGGGFFLHGADRNTITHNLIQDTAGAGIIIANWDDTTVNVGNAIAYNIVRNTNINSEDSGAIYLLGRSHVDTRAVISNNLVDGTGAGGDAHTIGIYLDDSSSGVLVAGNIIRNIGTHGAQIHGGDDITICNNIFDLGSGPASAVLFQTAPADTNPINTMRGNRVVGNIVYSSNSAPTLYSYLEGGTPEISGNLYDVLDSPAMAEPARDKHPQFGTARFADTARGDYRLGAGSAASAINFEPIDQTKMGPHPAAWARRNERAAASALPAASPEQ